jgi:hypothetical protein
MHEPITVTIRASSTETALLVKQGPDETMIARLGPASWADQRALPALMEGLALWFQSRIRVVLCAASEQVASSTGLVDGLGCGLGMLHFEVDVVAIAAPASGCAASAICVSCVEKPLVDLRGDRAQAQRSQLR